MQPHRFPLCSRFQGHLILFGVHSLLCSTSHRHHDILLYQQDLLRRARNGNLWCWNPCKYQKSDLQPVRTLTQSVPVSRKDVRRSGRNDVLSRYLLKYRWLRNGSHVRSHRYGLEDLCRNAFCLHKSSYDAGSSLDGEQRTLPPLPLQGTYCLCNDPNDRMFYTD